MTTLINQLLTPLVGGKDKNDKKRELDSRKRGMVPRTPLAPVSFRAVCKSETPMFLDNEDIACFIDYMPGGDVFIETFSRGKTLSAESINPRSRAKKAVTSFTYKGLLGVHVHPRGVVLYLSQEENLRGEPRHNQPAAEVWSQYQEATVEAERAQRILRVDLHGIGDDNPVVINPNITGKELMHMVIKPLNGQVGDVGVYLSSVKGQTRDKGEPTFRLEPGRPTVLDRGLFAEIVRKDPGNIDARAWNIEVQDPITVELTLSEKGELTIEEYFTTNGITVMVGEQPPVFLAALGSKLEEEEPAFRQFWLEQTLRVRATLLQGLEEKLREQERERHRSEVVGAVYRSLRMETNEGVSCLAFELAVKEVLASAYGDTGGSETAMSFDALTTNLIMEITAAAVGLLESERMRNDAVAAVTEAIRDAAQRFPIEGFDALLLAELPRSSDKTPTSSEDGVFADIRAGSVKYLLLTKHIKRLKSIKSDRAQEGLSPEDLARLDGELVERARRWSHTAFRGALVRFVVMKRFSALERERREACRLPPKGLMGGAGNSELPPDSLASIIKRYDAYDKYMESAFQQRIQSHLDARIKAFQRGEQEEQEQKVATKNFLTYLIAMYASGGNLEASSDSTPAVSPLQMLPEVVPELRIVQPSLSKTDAFVKVRHNGSETRSIQFEAGKTGQVFPDGVPEALWVAFRDMSERILDFYLTGATAKKEDRQARGEVVDALAYLLLRKWLNLLGNVVVDVTPNGYGDLLDILRRNNAVVALRPGETPGEEVLDRAKRTPSTKESPLDLRKALRKVLLDVQRNRGTKEELYRFKSRTGSASMGSATRKVSTPLRIEATGGAITIEAEFGDTAFSRIVHVPLHESTEPAPSAVAPTPIPASPRPAPAVAPAAAVVPPPAVPPPPPPVRYPLEPGDLPLDLGKVRLAQHGGALVLLQLDDAGQPRLQNGRIMGHRLDERLYPVGKIMKVNMVDGFIYVHCPQPYPALEGLIRKRRSNRVALPLPVEGLILEVIIPRTGASELRAKLTVDGAGQVRVGQPFQVSGDRLSLPARNGSRIIVAGFQIEQRDEGLAVKVSNEIQGGIVLRNGDDLYPLRAVTAAGEDDEDVTVLGAGL
ncbi:MAG: hypothetical protein H7831_12895 [Magnetococcus sp. WYHC-3]